MTAFDTASFDTASFDAESGITIYTARELQSDTLFREITTGQKMSTITITRTRNSTKRIAFQWSVVTNGISAPLDLTGMTLQMLVDTEKIESVPATPVRLATINGVVTSAVNGQAYFPITTAVTGAIQKLYFEVWTTDANSETYPIDTGVLSIPGGLK